MPVDPNGPIRNAGQHPVVTPTGGVECPGYQFDPATFAGQISNKAKWVWTGPDDGVGARFRKEIDLAEITTQVIVRITADRKYRLWINGKLASRGPADHGRDYMGGNTGSWFYDVRDLTPFFEAGRNVIAVEVFHKWPVEFVVSIGRGGFWFDADDIGVFSDATWRSAVIDGYEISDDRVTVDAAAEPPRWREHGFDDSQWSVATVLGEKAKWPKLVLSEIPPLMEVRYPPVRVEKTDTHGSIKLIFDRVLSGHVVMSAVGEDGASIEIKGFRTTTIRCRGGVPPPGRAEGGGTPGATPPLHVETLYMDEIPGSVDITAAGGDIKILDADVVFTAQPVKYLGSFRCDDDFLNRLWDVGRWAVQINLQTHHLDSPNHQEPISDPGDYVIESAVNWHCFGSPWLARQDLKKFAALLVDLDYQNFHTSYSIAWLQWLRDYTMFTGDTDLPRELSVVVFGLLEHWKSYIGDNGILSRAPNYMFMDWITLAGFKCHHPPAVIGQGYLTALYCHGLTIGAWVAELAGHPKRAQEFQLLRSQLVDHFNRELWDEEVGRYCDGKPFQSPVKPAKWLPADVDIKTFSPHVNLLAVLYDIAPKEQHEAIVERVLAEEPLNVQPWFMHWVFDAVDHAGLFEKHAMKLLKRWEIVESTRSFREMWDTGDLSHGWCSTPTVQLSSRVLGIVPTSPGFATFDVHPHPCGLERASGKVPTPHGMIVVAWSNVDGRIDIDLTVPKGTIARIIDRERVVGSFPAGNYGAIASMITRRVGQNA